ncbi:MAG: hypothetical protein AAFX99_23440 [Myxococcota bacterium]
MVLAASVGLALWMTMVGCGASSRFVVPMTPTSEPLTLEVASVELEDDASAKLVSVGGDRIGAYTEDDLSVLTASMRESFIFS